MVGGRHLRERCCCAASCILAFKAQAQRRIARRTRFVPGVISIQPRSYFLTPGGRIIRVRLAAFAGRWRISLARNRRIRIVWLRIQRCTRCCGGAQAGLRFLSWRTCGTCFGSALANVTAKWTRHESGLKRISTDGACRITAKSAPESKTSNHFCLVRHGHAKFTTTAAARGVQALLGRLDDGVPMIFLR